MSSPAARVFLSYRREETRHLAGRLADRMGARFGPRQVFMDVDNIEPGVDFTTAITRAVSSCDILLAVIGPKWSNITDKYGRRRLKNPNDFVALEVQAGLDRDIVVIPVLVDGAEMPSTEDLPDSIAGLARRNAVRIDHDSFSSDSARLLTAIERALDARRYQPHVDGEQPTARTGSLSTPPGPAIHDASPPTRPIGRLSQAPEASQRSDRGIPVYRHILRIALWWLAFALAIFTAAGFGLSFSPKSTVGAVGTIVLCSILLLALGGLLAGLHKEVASQRKIIRQHRPELAEAGSNQWPVAALSPSHIKKVYVYLIAAALLFATLAILFPG